MSGFTFSSGRCTCGLALSGSKGQCMSIAHWRNYPYIDVTTHTQVIKGDTLFSLAKHMEHGGQDCSGEQAKYPTITRVLSNRWELIYRVLRVISDRPLFSKSQRQMIYCLQLSKVTIARLTYGSGAGNDSKQEDIDHGLDLLAEQLVKLKENILYMFEPWRRENPHTANSKICQHNWCIWVLGYYGDLGDLYRNWEIGAQNKATTSRWEVYDTDIEFEIAKYKHRRRIRGIEEWEPLRLWRAICLSGTNFSS